MDTIHAPFTQSTHTLHTLQDIHVAQPLTAHALGEVAALKVVQRVPHVLHARGAGGQAVQRDHVQRLGLADRLRQGACNRGMGCVSGMCEGDVLKYIGG